MLDVGGWMLDVGGRLASIVFFLSLVWNFILFQAPPMDCFQSCSFGLGTSRNGEIDVFALQKWIETNEMLLTWNLLLKWKSLMSGCKAHCSTKNWWLAKFPHWEFSNNCSHLSRLDPEKGLNLSWLVGEITQKEKKSKCQRWEMTFLTNSYGWGQIFFRFSCSPGELPETSQLAEVSQLGVFFGGVLGIRWLVGIRRLVGVFHESLPVYGAHARCWTKSWDQSCRTNRFWW